MKVYCFPGVGADESLGRYFDLPGFDLVWIRWPAVEAVDWDGFVAALEAENDIAEGAVFLGISFGGMAALAFAERKRAGGVALVGSCRDSRAVSPLLRVFKPWVRRMPAWMFRVDLMPRWMAGWWFGVREPEHLDLLYAMGRKLPPARFRSINALALEFRGGEPPGITVFSVHGARDRMIAAGAERRDVVIPEGGHLIVMSHPEEVNRALRGWLLGLERAAGGVQL
jgi:pimeloyl-ACP methyl ester carboxylesterase